MSGAPGHTGPTGATGRRGLQGTPYGAPGTAFYSPSGRVPIVKISNATSQTVAPGGYGTTYVVTDISFNSIVFPESMSAGDVGAFWTFRNNTSSALLDIALTSGSIVYNGLSAGVDVRLAAGNSITFVYTGVGTSYIAI